MNWVAVILSLPTENATARQRAWRALKASGAAVLRDGVYLMPQRPECCAALEALAADVRESGGLAHVLNVEEPEGANFVAMFDRSNDFADVLAEINKAWRTLTADSVDDVLRQARKLRKSFAALVEIDFYPGAAQGQVDGALRELELACARAFSSDEPQAVEGKVVRLEKRDYQGRIWATRARPWVDRLASAWLIKRFIDQRARILWLASPADAPSNAVTFDFDGAAFTHVAGRVTFEALAGSFSLERPAIVQLGHLVHFLDVGGAQPPEAAGVESVLAGLRAGLPDDDQLLAAASAIFDGLLMSFERGSATARENTE